MHDEKAQRKPVIAVDVRDRATDGALKEIKRSRCFKVVRNLGRTNSIPPQRYESCHSGLRVPYRNVKRAGNAGSRKSESFTPMKGAAPC